MDEDKIDKVKYYAELFMQRKLTKDEIIILENAYNQGYQDGVSDVENDINGF